MPIYDYQCQSCHFKSEVMRKISAPSTETCPQCGLETFSKQLSAPSFQLNGSGWYATDFKNNDKKSAASNNKSAEKESNQTSESKAAEVKSDDKKPDTGGCKTGCACH